MKIIGYMEGTNSEILTNLLLEGYETLPLSNGFDNHGKYIAHLTRADNIALIIGYLHKFFAVAKEFSVAELLSSIKVYKIPVIFIVPKAHQAKARKLLGAKGIKYAFADPSEATRVALSMLKPRKGSKAPARKKSGR
jgi:hypothetical protein